MSIAAGAFDFSHEDIMNFVLITLPTMLLAIVTLTDNEHMYKITMKALDRIRPSRRRLTTAHRHVQGRHERPRQSRWGRSEERGADQPTHNATKFSASDNFMTKPGQEPPAEEEGTPEAEPELGMDSVPASAE